MKFITSFSLPEKFKKNIGIIVLGLVIIIFTSLIASSRQSRIIPPLPPQMPNTTTAPQTNTPLIITNYSPHGLNPPIANTSTAVYFEFNREFEDSEIAGLNLTSKPAVPFKKIVHVNRRIIYFTPSILWKDGTVYTVTLSSSRNPELKSFYFGPMTQVDLDGVIQSEENLPKP